LILVPKLLLGNEIIRPSFAGAPYEFKPLTQITELF
jgi:hypothetical protein